MGAETYRHMTEKRSGGAAKCQIKREKESSEIRVWKNIYLPFKQFFETQLPFKEPKLLERMTRKMHL